MRLGNYRQRLVLNAGMHGSLTAFMMTHGLILHLIPLVSPFLILSAPIAGGITARNRAYLGKFGAPAVTLMIAVANTFPYLVLLPLVYLNRGLFPNQETADRVITGVTWAILGYFVYSALGAAAGIWIRHRRPPKVRIGAALALTRAHRLQAADLGVMLQSDTRIGVDAVFSSSYTPLEAGAIQPSQN